MSTVVMHNVVSVDGFIADDKDDIGPLFDWYGNGDVEVAEGNPARVSQASADYIRPTLEDVAAAVAKAKELAGDRSVGVAAGDVGGQALALGLVDEVAMDVVPVVFGSGKRYFGPVDGQHLLEDPDVVIRGDRVLHLRYRVRR
ncbi:MAG: dihydrofolate reductase [Actinomycetes bacterium]